MPLPRGVISVGSSPNNHIVVEELTVSPRHMEIYVSREGLSIRNLNELNRTIINGDSVSIDRTPLKPGDKLIIGRTAVRVMA